MALEQLKCEPRVGAFSIKASKALDLFVEIWDALSNSWVRAPQPLSLADAGPMPHAYCSHRSGNSLDGSPRSIKSSQQKQRPNKFTSPGSGMTHTVAWETLGAIGKRYGVTCTNR